MPNIEEIYRSPIPKCWNCSALNRAGKFFCDCDTVRSIELYCTNLTDFREVECFNCQTTWTIPNKHGYQIGSYCPICVVDLFHQPPLTHGAIKVDIDLLRANHDLGINNRHFIHANFPPSNQPPLPPNPAPAWNTVNDPGSEAPRPYSGPIVSNFSAIAAALNRLNPGRKY